MEVQCNYRVREPFRAIRHGPRNAFSYITISPGSVITVKAETQEVGLVDVLYEGKIVTVFVRDLDARADLIEAARS